MSIQKDFYNLEEDKTAVSALVDELCLMTECVHDQALTELINCNFDLQSAANKILESTNNKHSNNEWQIINRQKKLKKKTEKVDSESNEEGVKKFDSKLQGKYRSPNQKFYNTNNEGKFNNRIYRHRKVRTLNKKSKDVRSNDYSNEERYVEHQAISDENELRWDNVADINGSIKELARNDGFYSDDDFGFTSQNDDNSFCGPSTHLVSDIQREYKTKINTKGNVLINNKNPQERGTSIPLESQLIDDCLSNQIHIFGKFSQTEAPKSLSKIPDEPVSFFRPIKSKKLENMWQYNFGVNITKSLAIKSGNETKYTSPKYTEVQTTNFSNDSNLFQSRNQIFPLNNSSINEKLHSHVKVTADYNGIMNTIMEQKKVVAMAFRNHPTNYISFSKPISMLPMSNSDHFDPIYSMNIQTADLHPNINDEMKMNYLSGQSECDFINQSTFLASNNISVPFRANSK